MCLKRPTSYTSPTRDYTRRSQQSSPFPMESAMQDDDIWRRAFAENSGLFDSISFGSLLGDAVTGDAHASPAFYTHGVATPADPTRTSTSKSSSAVIPPSPALGLTTFLDNSKENVHSCLSTFPPQAESAPPLLASEPPVSEPVLPPQSVQEVANRNASPGSGSAPPRVAARGSDAKVPVQGADLSPTRARVLAMEPLDDYQEPAPQRGGESFARKRDRAKLLRQQMNGGLDNLHEALVEISTSGANPSAAATTSLIPIRGPRRATVVACSSGLVRDLISVCVALRAENASLKERLTAAVPASTPSPRVFPSPPTKKKSDPLADGESVKKQHTAVTKSGDGAARVFEQLLALGVFGFLGPQSLGEGRRVCCEWRDKCTWDCCWSNLCVSRWRLCPEQRHAEVWRVGARDGGRGIISSPTLPPSWRQVYGRLHQSRRVPTGALSPAHLVIGNTVQQGVAIWVALSRRSNGMTSRSVIDADSRYYRTTEVVELRVVVQRVGEGPAVKVHPRGITVFRVQGPRASLSAGASSVPLSITKVVLPSLPADEERFWPRMKINSGVDRPTISAVLTGSGSSNSRLKGGSVTDAGGFPATRPICLFEYTTVDFFIEAPGYPSEADFLRLEACVDVTVSFVAEAPASDEVKVLPVALTDGSRGAATADTVARWAERPSKRRGSIE